MTQEDKDLLFKDLSARLPYGVKAYMKKWSKLDRKYYEGVYTVESVHPSLNDIYGSTENGSVEVILGCSDYDIKPYLFPLSSMTEEQKEEYHYIVNYISPDDTENWAEGEFVYVNQIEQLLHFYHVNHLDYRGLIPKDLALDATGLNIY